MEQSQTKYVVVTLVLKPEFLDQFMILSEVFVSKVREEEGNLYYHFIKSIKTENTFFYIGSWKDQEALEFHMRSDHFAQIVPQFGEFANDINVNMCDHVF